MKPKLLSSSKLVAITAIGGCLEFFDFTIFALFSTYISQAFFPFDTQLTGLINTFAVFAVGYFARPLGGLWISHVGDRQGRKKSLLMSIHLMALATFLIAILPTYQHIGLLAPILLILLRLLQGSALGGEMPGMVTYLSEHFHMGNPVRALGFVFGLVTCGNMFASGLGFVLSSVFSSHFMASWGWRIPFLIGSLLGCIGAIVRTRTKETQIFERLEYEQAIHRIPFLVLIKSHSSLILMGAGLTALTSTTIFLFLYLPTLVHTIFHEPIQTAYLFSTLNFTFLGLSTVFFGLLSKKQKLVKMTYLGIILATLTALIAMLMHAVTFYAFACFSLLVAIFSGLVNSHYTVIISHLFPASIRYSGIAMSYNIGLAVFGAVMPFLFLTAYKTFHAPLAPFFFLFLAGLLTFYCAWRASKYSLLTIGLLASRKSNCDNL